MNDQIPPDSLWASGDTPSERARRPLTERQLRRRAFRTSEVLSGDAQFLAVWCHVVSDLAANSDWSEMRLVLGVRAEDGDPVAQAFVDAGFYEIQCQTNEDVAAAFDDVRLCLTPVVNDAIRRIRSVSDFLSFLPTPEAAGVIAALMRSNNFQGGAFDSVLRAAGVADALEQGAATGNIHVMKDSLSKLLGDEVIDLKARAHVLRIGEPACYCRTGNLEQALILTRIERMRLRDGG